MSRSMGGRSLTTVSPMSTSPELMDSRPATIRNVVVLPHPDGPTRTRNSLSRISRFTSLTTCVASNILFKLQSSTLAMASPFDVAGETGNVILDEERVDNRHRNRAQQRACHELPPEKYVPADQLGGDADRHRLLSRRREKHQRVDELVPRQGERKDCR